MSDFNDRLSRVLEQSIYGDFILGIIHNLSTPLSGILGGAQLLEMRLKNWMNLFQNLSSSDKETLEKIIKEHEKNIGNVELVIRNARNLSELISNMVQVHNKTVIEEAEVVSLSEFLKQVFKFLEGNMIFKHQVKKEFVIPTDLHPVRFVYNHVAQLLIEWVRRCLPALDQEKSPQLNVTVEQNDKNTILMLKLNVPFEESPPLADFPTELIPFLQGIRLPFSYYTKRLQHAGHQVELKTDNHETTLQITFQS
jgi:hypothetical protein